MSAKSDITRASASKSAPTETSLENLLVAHAFVKDMAPHLRQILSDLAMRVSFVPNEIIFREGDPANRFYLIHTGKVVLEAHAADGDRVLIETLGAGDVLGWSWLFPPYYWHFDARAVEATEAIFFFGTPLRTECEEDHELGYELLKRMSEIVINRLQVTRRQLLECHAHRPGHA
jgi:CRP/FNR family transcriptional regulator, cyclic AMP receptor protein